MQIQVFDSYYMLSREAGRLVAEAVIDDPEARLGLATGGTPLGLYAELVRLHHQEELHFMSVICFNLDEYVGLAPDAPESYSNTMQRLLFRHINITPHRCFIPNGGAADPEAEVKRYTWLLKKYGPLDIQVLGIGGNGHIGFNEPGSSWDSRTRVLDLEEATREANARFFGGDVNRVPKQAITMGIADIMEARQILLLARGRDKAEIVREALYGPQTEAVPASVLQRHPNLVVLLDKEAAERLP